MSIFTLGEVNVALFPATSVTVTLPVTEEPSEVNERGLCIEVEAKPDNPSVAVKGTDTFVLFQPAPFGVGDRLALIVGGSLSTPTIWIANVPPGCPRTWTEIVFEA